MSSKNVSCAGCCTVIKGKEYLKCCKCSSVYDLACANVNDKRFTSFYSSSTAAGRERRATWTCPECLCNVPKGDNLSTPLRSHNDEHGSPPLARGLTPNSPTDNVTQRKKPDVDYDIIKLIKIEIQAAVRSELAPLKDQLNHLTDSVQYISNQYDDLIKTTNSILENYQSMKTECTHLRSTVITLTERLNNLEQHLRDSNIEIQGMPQQRNENIVEIVRKIADVVSLKIEDRDILSCTRVASMNKDSRRPRAIVVKLSSTRRRDEFYSAVSRFNKARSTNKLSTSLLGIGGDNSLIYVSEHLSPANKALHAATRAKAKHLSYKFVWVRNGRIFMRKDETSRFIHVKNQQLLDSLEQSSV